LLWRRKLPPIRYDYSQLIGMKGAVVAGGGQGHLVAFDLPAGTLRWRYRVKLRWYHQLRGLFPFSFGYVGAYRHAGLTGIQ
jgi:outer membrane protein assembly factor BamB